MLRCTPNEASLKTFSVRARLAFNIVTSLKLTNQRDGL